MKKDIIVTRNYMSTNDFVGVNNLEKEAIKCFGGNWEAADDIKQIEILLEYTENEFHEAIFMEEVRGGYDIKVKFNSDLKEIHDLKVQNKALIERLNASHKAIDEATDVISRNDLPFRSSEEFEELLSQLAPNEELLRKVEND